MVKILVWDIPARLLHWGFAGSLAAAIGIGFLADDDQPIFQLHMIFGIIAVVPARAPHRVGTRWLALLAFFQLPPRSA